MCADMHGPNTCSRDVTWAWMSDVLDIGQIQSGSISLSQSDVQFYLILNILQYCLVQRSAVMQC